APLLHPHRVPARAVRLRELRGVVVADKYSLVAGDEIRWSTPDGLLETPDFHVITKVTEDAYVVYPKKDRAALAASNTVGEDLVGEFETLAPARVSVELPAVEPTSPRNRTADCTDGHPVQVYLDAEWSGTIFSDLS